MWTFCSPNIMVSGISGTLDGQYDGIFAEVQLVARCFICFSRIGNKYIVEEVSPSTTHLLLERHDDPVYI